MLRKIFSALLCAIAVSAMAADKPADPSISSAETSFIRDALVKKGQQLGLDKSPELEQRIAEFRQEQLAELALDAARNEGMPDFSARAEEIYQARKDTQYHLPLRLRVWALELRLPAGKEAAIRDKLNAIRTEVAAGKATFEAAVKANSEASDLSLTKGDTQWFHKGQKPDVFFDAAAQLSADKPLSEVVVHRDTAYLLYFIGRKESETLAFDTVKSDILNELQDEYRADHEQMLLDSLHEQFKHESADKPALSRNDAM